MDEHMRLSGVYIITNTANQREYVGSTVRPFARRWQEHTRTLNEGVHPNPQLQEDWNKYGAQSFEFTICEFVEGGVYRVVEREYYWLQQRQRKAVLYNRHQMMSAMHRSNHPPKQKYVGEPARNGDDAFLTACPFDTSKPVAISDLINWLALTKRDQRGNGNFVYLPVERVIKLIENQLRDHGISKGDAVDYIAKLRSQHDRG